jgi:Protein of unknown function (DUF2889)
VQLLRRGSALLLDLHLRLSNLQHLHGRKSLGIDLQRGELAVPGLRGPEAFSGVNKNMTSLKEMIHANPIHSRIMDFKTYALENERVIVRGRLTDERFQTVYDLGGQVRDKGVVHDMVIYLLIGGMPLTILEADAEMPHVPLDLCTTTRESIRRIVGLEIKSGFGEKVHKLIGGGVGCAHLTHLLVVMAQAALHGHWTHKMSRRRPVPRTLDEIEELSYFVDSCALWKEDGPIVQGIKKILDESTSLKDGQ